MVSLCSLDSSKIFKPLLFIFRTFENRSLISILLVERDAGDVDDDVGSAMDVVVLGLTVDRIEVAYTMVVVGSAFCAWLVSVDSSIFRADVVDVVVVVDGEENGFLLNVWLDDAKRIRRFGMAWMTLVLARNGDGVELIKYAMDGGFRVVVDGDGDAAYAVLFWRSPDAVTCSTGGGVLRKPLVVLLAVYETRFISPFSST